MVRKRRPSGLILPNDRTPGRLYKLDRGSLGIATIGDPVIDERRMSATAIISTPAVDRVKDSVNPKGIRLENYKQNPVVLYDHGFDYTLPIGRSETPSGTLTIKASTKNVMAACYFHGKTLESEQIFELVASGHLRGTSVRIGQCKTRMRGEVQDIDDWELEEWSWTAIGCNPETLAQTVHKNRLAGHSIAEPIMKSLRTYLPQRQTQGIGWSPPDPDDQGQHERGSNRMSKHNEPELDDLDVDLPSVPRNKNQTYGSQLLAATYAEHAYLVDRIKHGLAALENVAVKSLLQEFSDQCDGQLTALSGAFAEQYPSNELPKLKSLDADEQESAMVEYLKSAFLPRAQLGGLHREFDVIAKSEHLTASERRAVKQIQRQFSGLLASAVKSTGKQPEETTNPEITKALDAMKSQAAEIKQIIDDIRPHNTVA